jgi:serine protease AprX
VAGIAAGDGTASKGLYRGVAPEASLLVAKVLTDDGGGDASDVIAGLEWALENGAQVACLSLGGSQAGDGTDALSVTCDELAEQGLVICVAAGNAGPRSYTVGPPGCAREVITVGAADTTHADQGAITVATFSSRGPTTDKRVKPDLLFPGVAIAACRAAAGDMGDPVSDFPEHYVRASGSSMAAPFAAGAAALILQAHPEATPRQVREMLCAAAGDLGEDANAQGSGLANIARALEVVPSDDVLEPPPVPERSGCLLAGLPALAALLPPVRRRG